MILKVGFCRWRKTNAAFCKPCATEINIESMGVQALKSHMRGTEHKLRDGTSAAESKGSSKIPSFFKQTSVKSVVKCDISVHSNDLSSSTPGSAFISSKTNHIFCVILIVTKISCIEFYNLSV